ncbi:Hypothetical Protein FCC1311_089462 [Hondaea fermentalgiana]|uniref:Cytochrome b561 domain-containing protein n=1 Tax=Hondaea fermentalgiana TaxID=2315210 RepID=A0A2R5GWD5_9STRA|nr:Hypothetical Protein FCC1311_089462 [Hondaea fermentalgiana]|eukprot:GBG32721.1 Hypothetical Protein FCC1311_089462 [Hondaea fermentalgiana]
MGSDAKSKDAKEAVYARFKWPCVAFGVGVGAYSAMLPGSWTWFSWHPLIMSVVCFVIATLGTLLKKIGGLENTRTHAKLLTGGTALLWFGFYVIYTNKEMARKEHFLSWHAWIGLMSLFGWSASIPPLNATIHPDFGKAKTNQSFRFMHRWTGRIILALSWLACFTGFQTMQPNLWMQVIVAVPLIVATPMVLV